MAGGAGKRGKQRGNHRSGTQLAAEGSGTCGERLGGGTRLGGEPGMPGGIHGEAGADALGAGSISGDQGVRQWLVSSGCAQVRAKEGPEFGGAQGIFDRRQGLGDESLGKGAPQDAQDIANEGSREGGAAVSVGAGVGKDDLVALGPVQGQEQFVEAGDALREGKNGPGKQAIAGAAEIVIEEGIFGKHHRPTGLGETDAEEAAMGSIGQGGQGTKLDAVGGVRKRREDTRPGARKHGLEQARKAVAIQQGLGELELVGPAGEEGQGAQQDLTGRAISLDEAAHGEIGGEGGLVKARCGLDGATHKAAGVEKTRETAGMLGDGGDGRQAIEGLHQGMQGAQRGRLGGVGGWCLVGLAQPLVDAAGDLGSIATEYPHAGTAQGAQELLGEIEGVGAEPATPVKVGRGEDL